jgi:hypothetical protein
MSELTLSTVQSQLTAQHKLLVSEETIEEINRLATESDYGAEFLETYMDCMNVLADSPKNNPNQYLRAIKFYSLVEAGNSLTDAYIKVFPERYEARSKNHDNPEKSIMRGEASRYNGTRMVGEIRKVTAIPVHLIHRHLLHAAILETADLMKNARSEMVRAKAADTLIRELKPAEENTLQVKVEDNTTSVIAELQKATKALAAEQYKSVMAGVPLKSIAAARLLDKDEEIIEGECSDG